LPGGDAVRVRFSAPKRGDLLISGLRAAKGTRIVTELKGEWEAHGSEAGKLIRVAHDRLLEVAFPLGLLVVGGSSRLQFSLSVEKNNQSLELQVVLAAGAIGWFRAGEIPSFYRILRLTPQVHTSGNGIIHIVRLNICYEKWLKNPCNCDEPVKTA
jgi:hypothetical protein